MVSLSLTAAGRQMQGKRKGAAVEIFYRSKVKKISGTARVSCEQRSKEAVFKIFTET